MPSIYMDLLNYSNIKSNEISEVNKGLIIPPYIPELKDYISILKTLLDFTKSIKLTNVMDVLNSYLASYYLINKEFDLAIPLLEEMKESYMNLDYIFYNYILELLIKIYSNKNDIELLAIHQLLLLQSYFKYYIHFVEKIPLLLNEFYNNTKSDSVTKQYYCFINNLISLPLKSILLLCLFIFF